MAESGCRSLVIGNCYVPGSTFLSQVTMELQSDDFMLFFHLFLARFVNSQPESLRVAVCEPTQATLGWLGVAVALHIRGSGMGWVWGSITAGLCSRGNGEVIFIVRGLVGHILQLSTVLNSTEINGTFLSTQGNIISLLITISDSLRHASGRGHSLKLAESWGPVVNANLRMATGPLWSGNPVSWG